MNKVVALALLILLTSCEVVEAARNVKESSREVKHASLDLHATVEQYRTLAKTVAGGAGVLITAATVALAVAKRKREPDA